MKEKTTVARLNKRKIQMKRHGKNLIKTRFFPLPTRDAFLFPDAAFILNTKT